jgi:hypothetical protein
VRKWEGGYVSGGADSAQDAHPQPGRKNAAVSAKAAQS